MAKMDDSTLANIVKNRIGDSVGLTGDQLSSDRITALKYYRGDLFGNEKEGRSQVVSRDVAEAVDGILPGIMKVFTSGDEIVRFEPKGPEDEQACKQATDYVNWIVMQQNDGFRTFYTWFKDALLQKTGIVKVWWDETEKITKEVYRDLTEEQYQMLANDPSIEISEEEVDESAYLNSTSMSPLLAQPTYTVTVSRTNKTGRVCIEPVPPEEFIIEKEATSQDNALFTGHRFRRTVSWWLGQYPEKETEIHNAAGYGVLDLTGERAERFGPDGYGSDTEGVDDESTALVWGAECYLQVDYDGDGLAEFRKVTVIGDSEYEVLDNEETDDHPFAACSPILMPHKFHGMSVADQTMHFQLWKSTLIRQMNDNLYLTNDPQRIVVEGKVNLNDLLSGGPGRVVRATAVDAVREVAVPFWAKETFPMLEYIDQMKEGTTGVTSYSQGLDPNALNKTATGISILSQAGQQRPELIARCFAETGVKRLFKLVLGCVTKYQNQAQVIRLRNQWTQIDPREWKNSYDMVVNVGLGTGNKQEQIATLTNLLEIDKAILELQGGIDGPIVTAKNLYNKLVKLVEASGLKSPEAYYTDPDTAPPQEKKPSPEEMKAQAELQKMQAQMQMDQQKAQLDAQTKQQEAQMSANLEMAKANQEVQIMWMKANAQIEVERMKASVQAELAAQNAERENERKNFQTSADNQRADSAAEREAERAERE